MAGTPDAQRRTALFLAKYPGTAGALRLFEQARRRKNSRSDHRADPRDLLRAIAALAEFKQKGGWNTHDADVIIAANALHWRGHAKFRERTQIALTALFNVIDHADCLHKLVQKVAVQGLDRSQGGRPTDRALRAFVRRLIVVFEAVHGGDTASRTNDPDTGQKSGRFMTYAKQACALLPAEFRPSPESIAAGVQNHRKRSGKFRRETKARTKPPVN